MLAGYILGQDLSIETNLFRGSGTCPLGDIAKVGGRENEASILVLIGMVRIRLDENLVLVTVTRLMAVPVNVSRFFCILLQNVKNLGKLDGLIALSIRADGEGQLIDTIFANDDVPIGVIRGTGSSGYGIGLRGTGFLCSPVGKLIAFFASIFVGAITRGILGIITVGLALSAVKIIGCGTEGLLIQGPRVCSSWGPG